ncbi:alpha/beta fold hydrolase [Pelagibaculum spongiae]|nr:alpha/beta hydrolase [Pelagibaculum spongiae]
MLLKKLAISLLLSMIMLLQGCSTLGMNSVTQQEMNQKYADQTTGSRFIEIDGLQVHYRDQGEGPVLLLLHGILDSLHTWDKWIEEFGEGYRIVRLDYPGFGLTGGWQDGEYSKERWLAFFDQFLNKIGIDQPIHVVGNSLGGGFAWQLAVARPERVKTIVMIDPAGYAVDGTPWPVTLASTPLIGSVMRYSTPPFIFRQGVKQVFGNPDNINPADVERFVDLSTLQGNRSAYVDVFRYLTKMLEEREAMLKQIPNIQVPVQLQWGEKDPWFPADIETAMWKKDLPYIDLVIFEGVGHMPQLEVPKKSAQAAMGFIEKND